MAIHSSIEDAIVQLIDEHINDTSEFVRSDDFSEMFTESVAEVDFAEIIEEYLTSKEGQDYLVDFISENYGLEPIDKKEKTNDVHNQE